MTSLANRIGDLEGRGPLYRRLQDALRRAIETSVIGPQDALPPERDLAADFAVSRITVRKALDGLVAEGLLTRKQGAGTFVSGRVEKQFAKLTSFSEDMASRGRKPHSKWLVRAAGTVTPEESLTLGLSPGAPVYRFNRTRFGVVLPMAMEYSTVTGLAGSSLLPCLMALMTDSRTATPIQCTASSSKPARFPMRSLRICTSSTISNRLGICSRTRPPRTVIEGLG